MATLDWLPKHIVVIIFLWSTLIVKDLNGFIYLTRMFTLSSFEVDVELNLFDILIGKKFWLEILTIKVRARLAKYWFFVLYSTPAKYTGNFVSYFWKTFAFFSRTFLVGFLQVLYRSIVINFCFFQFKISLHSLHAYDIYLRCYKSYRESKTMMLTKVTTNTLIIIKFYAA